MEFIFTLGELRDAMENTFYSHFYRALYIHSEKVLFALEDRMKRWWGQTQSSKTETP